MTFKPSERERAVLYLDRLFEKKRHVKIDYVTESKTISQNNYFWLIVSHVANETGNDKNDIYQLLLSKYAPEKYIELAGEDVRVITTLSGMSKEQASLFIDKSAVYFRCQGFDIPDPEDLKTIEMYNYYKQKGWM